jgi:ferredoxin
MQLFLKKEDDNQMKESKQWSEKQLTDFEKRWKAVTIPVNIRIENKQIALDLTRINQILMEAEKIAITDCICRATLQNCKYPRNTCISLNIKAEIDVRNGYAKYISREQAMSIVTETTKLGLVHLTLNPPNKTDQFPSAICSCCPCCCHALQGLKLMNMKGLVKPSELVSTLDIEICNQCGICVERCQFGARVLNSDNNIIFKQDLCFGCGLCVISCPENSIELIPRKKI